MLDASRSFVRFVAGLPRFMREPMSLTDARTWVAGELARREENFLHLAERLIYANPRSPYRPLLAMAGCELGDLRDSVARHGLEATLERLRDEGVYVSFEEFKGREPIVRRGRHVPCEPADFSNPLSTRSIASTTGGSTGPATQTRVDLRRMRDEAFFHLVDHDATGTLGAPTSMWRETLPGTTGLNTVLRDTKVGQLHERWFAPPSAFGGVARVRYDAALRLVLAAARAGGARIPRPEEIGEEAAWVAAAWAADRARRHGRSVVRTTVSRQVRIALAATERGLDLSGVVLMGGGEALTEGKLRTVKAAGARCHTFYYSGEASWIGTACPAASVPNDMHLLGHSLAVIQRRREVPSADLTVSSFLFTALLDSCPSVMLNVELDDYGVIEERACGCALEGLGLTKHMRDIYSFTKLTTEGVTMVGNDLIDVLEGLLPSRFGGTALDYQLQEEEDEDGLTRLVLVVDPRVDVADESALAEAFLGALRTSRLGTEAGHIWRVAETVRVRRAAPVVTTRGKQFPLVKLSRSSEGGRR